VEGSFLPYSINFTLISHQGKEPRHSRPFDFDLDPQLTPFKSNIAKQFEKKI